MITAHVCHRLTLTRKGTQFTAYIPDWLPAAGWSINSGGYLVYTSRSTVSGIPRGYRAHRLVMETLLGDLLPTDLVVHHADGNPLNCCPYNLVLMPPALNPRAEYRCPYTGVFLSREQYASRTGTGYSPVTRSATINYR